MKGLYKHCSGNYYYLTDISSDSEGNRYALCFDVLSPESGTMIIPLDKWDEETTKVMYIEPTLSGLSTEDLIRELGARKDSPLQKLDIEGLNKRVFSTDYVVGELYDETEESVKGVYTVAVFDTEKEAITYLENHPSVNARVLKRTFIVL